jgi:hypothetical protein
MKNSVLKCVVLAVLAVCALGVGVASADATFTVDPGALTFGYMNVLDLGGNFQWGNGWGIGDLTAVFSGNDVTLGPNCINDPNPYWYLPVGGPGSVGQHIMEANLYAQVDNGSLAGQNVTFQGFVLSNTLTSAHVAVAFVKDFAADWSSYQIGTIVLPASGAFSVTLATVNDVTRHVQWGFQVKGVNVWVTDLAPYGTAVVGPASVVPATSRTWGALKSLYR